MGNIFINNDIPELALPHDVKYPRLAYYAIKNHYEKWLNSLSSRKTYFDDGYINCSLGITGLRRIGKTTVLKQLYNSILNTCYIDCTEFTEEDNISDILEYIHSKGVKLCLVDELCRLKSDNGVGIECFISDVKSMYSDIYFIFTGSVSSAISGIISGILDCDKYNMIPITYAETLWWENGCKDYCEIYRDSTYDKYLDFITIKSDTNSRIHYISGIISDTLDSYNRRANSILNSDYLEFLESVTEEDIYRMMTYVELCQVIDIIDNPKGQLNKPINISFETTLKPYIKRYIKDLLNSLGKKKVKLFCYLLKQSGLMVLNKHYNYNVLEDTIMETPNAESYLFVMPQMVYHTYDKIITELDLSTTETYEPIKDAYQSLWVENTISMMCNLLFSGCGKYRDNNDTEIDILYQTSMFKYYLLEIKDRCNRHTRAFIDKACIHFNNCKSSIMEYIITCNNVFHSPIDYGYHFPNSHIMRNDIILITLELEYLLNQLNYELYCSNSIMELYYKHSNSGTEPGKHNQGKNNNEDNNEVKYEKNDSNYTSLF